MRQLVNAESETDAKSRYFALEGCCFPQRLVSESCVAVISCVMAALAEPVPSGFAFAWPLELLRGILAGEPIASEVEAGNSGVVDECCDEARKGLWLLYSLYVPSKGEDRMNLARILSILDPDPGRWTEILDGDPWRT